ncbi:MAG TPA: nucleotidyltransferase family protein [Acidimicrobiia bacterium]|nr:nucleotidyltransferase family protein [Acidimicrobiia bacterium]
MSRLAAAVLAAGTGSRFGAVTKPLAPFAGEPLVLHATRAALESGLAPVVVVVGHDAAAVTAVLPPEVEAVSNEGFASGIASSLQCALRALAARAVDGVVVGLADQPLVGAHAYQRVAAAYDDGARLAVATYGGRRANPVLVGREHWAEALELTGDEGARVVMRRHPVVEVDCDGTGDPTDIDTPADLAALEARWRSTTASE